MLDTVAARTVYTTHVYAVWLPAVYDLDRVHLRTLLRVLLRYVPVYLTHVRSRSPLPAFTLTAGTFRSSSSAYIFTLHVTHRLRCTLRWTRFLTLPISPRISHGPHHAHRIHAPATPHPHRTACVLRLLPAHHTCRLLPRTCGCLPPLHYFVRPPFHHCYLCHCTTTLFPATR